MSPPKKPSNRALCRADCEFATFSDSSSSGYCRIAAPGVATLSRTEFRTYINCLNDDRSTGCSEALQTFNEGTGCLRECQADFTVRPLPWSAH